MKRVETPVTEIRTIFLAADGRHTLLGRGDDIEMPDHLAETIRAAGVRGWVAIMAGDYYGDGPMQLARVHAVVPTSNNRWPAAIGRFMAARERGQK